jgi:hypothetical protein
MFPSIPALLTASAAASVLASTALASPTPIPISMSGGSASSQALSLVRRDNWTPPAGLNVTYQSEYNA